jgi:hypothetical protein
MESCLQDPLLLDSLQYQETHLLIGRNDIIGASSFQTIGQLLPAVEVRMKIRHEMTDVGLTIRHDVGWTQKVVCRLQQWVTTVLQR